MANEFIVKNGLVSPNVQLSGSTSGSVTITAPAVAGNTSITLPATAGTLVTTGDTGSVTNTMLAGSIANSKLSNSAVTVGTTSISLGASSTTLAGLTSVTSTSFVGALTGNASTATTLQTARTIALSGDVVGSVSFDGSGNATIATTIQADSVALGTDTTGNYMVNVTGGTGITVSHTQGEGSTATVSIGQAVGTTDNVTFNNVTVNGTLTSDDITSTNISVAGNATITGNLTVSGTTTTINSTTIAVADLNLELARNATTAAAANGAGITVTGPTTAATLIYTSTDDRWNLNKDLNIGRVYGNLTGAVTGNASTASAWQTSRTLSFTGDATGSMSIDGSTNASAALTLAASGVTSGTYNNVTVNSKGLVTSGSNIAYLTSYIETDTLATVTARGATSSTQITLSGGGDGSTTYSSLRFAGYNQGGGTGYHGFFEVQNTYASATNPKKFFRLDSAGSIQIINSAYTQTIFELTNAGVLTVPSTFSASNFSGTHSGISSGTNTGDQTITLTGDVTGGGTGTFATTLASTGVTAGTYNNVTVDAKGRVTSGSNTSYLTSYTETDTLSSVTGRGFTTRTSSGTFATANQGTPGLEVYGGGGAEPAYMTFHRPNQYAVRFGIDGTDLKVGGWSMGNAAYKIWHEGNLTNLNQLTNGPGYITGESDTLATVTSRGATSSVGVRLGGGTSNPASTTFSHTLAGVSTNRIVNFDGNGNGAPSVWWTSGSRAYGAIDAKDPGLTFWANNGTNWQQQFEINYGNVTVNTDIRSPIFYDSNDTTYYLDPNSSGTSLYVAGSIISGNGGSDTGLRINHGAGAGDYGRIRFYQAGSNNQTIHVFPTAWQGGTLASASAGAINLTGANGVTFGNWNDVAMWVSTAGVGQAKASLRAPIFYDSDNTGYYLDPASTSNLNALTTNGQTILGGQLYVSATNSNTLNSGWGVAGEADIWINYRGYNDAQSYYRNFNIGNGRGTAIFWASGSTGNVGIGTDQTAGARLHVRRSTPSGVQAINSNATLLLDNTGDNFIQFRNSADNGTYSGLLMSDNNQGGYVVFGNAGGAGDVLRLGGYGAVYFDVGTQDSTSSVALKTTAGLIDSAQNMYAYGSMRSPIFYDYNDTGYYVDPNSSSWGVYSAGGGRFRNIQISSSTYTDTIQHVNSGGYLWLQYGHNGKVGIAYGGGTVGVGPVDPSSGDRMEIAGNLRVHTGNNWDGVQIRADGANGYLQGLGDETGLHIRSEYGNVYIADNRGDVRMPMFYDVNDTGYYVDPNNTSNLNNLTLGGRNMRTFESNSFIEFYVEGDANTYYPVRFDVYGWFHWGRWSISRSYGDTAPWDPIGTGAHHGGLTFTWEWSGDGAWGGNDHSIRVVEYSEQYTTMVGGMDLSVNGMIVWLRGGHAYYRFHGPGGMNNGATPYYSTYTASNGATYSPRANASAAAGEINYRYPVRGSGNLYDWNHWVLHEDEWQNNKYFGSDGRIYTNVDIRSPIFYDNNDTSYYLDPNSTGTSLKIAGNIDLYARSASWAEGIRIRVPSTSTWGGIRWTRDRGNNDGNWALGYLGIDSTDDIAFWADNGGDGGAVRLRLTKDGHSTVSSSSRAPIFYDSNDTGYYIDPNSTSWTNVIKSAVFCGRDSNGYGMFKGYDNNNHFITIRGAVSGSNGAPSISGAHQTTFVEHLSPADSSTGWFFKDSYNGAAYTYNTIARISASDSWVKNYLTGENSLRAPIFYDSNDTAYYCNPNSFSQLSHANLNGAPSGRTLSLGGDQTDRVENDSGRNSLVINASYYPQIYMNAVSDSGNTTHGPVFSMTGNLTSGGYRRWGMGIANRNPNELSFGWYDNSANSHYGVGINWSYPASMWIDTGHNLYARGSMRAPIFYDYDDTGYYVDANSTSNMNTVTATNFRMGNALYLGGNNYFINNNSTWFGSNASFRNDADVRAPIFYDQNDTGYYADPNGTSVFNGLTINGTLNAYANPVKINRINFTNTSGSQASDPYCLRWRSETDGDTGSLSWLELQMNDDSNEEFRIYGYSCAGYACGQISSNLYHRFYANGDAWHAGNVTAYSDIRVKDNISIIDNAIDKVMQIRGVTFTRNDKADTETRHAGVIAQEVEAVLPEVVDTDEFGMKSVAYGNMVGLLIEAIKEQQKQIEELKGIINEIRR